MSLCLRNLEGDEGFQPGGPGFQIQLCNGQLFGPSTKCPCAGARGRCLTLATEFHSTLGSGKP